MKHIIKFLLVSILLIGAGITTADAQTYSYRSTEYAIKKTNSSGQWLSWSDWEPSNIRITMNLDTDIVRVYSATPQVYRITEFLQQYTDESGGKQLKFKFVDQDGDRGYMRLRVETNGNSQLYIEFNNVMWVYNVRRVD